MRKYEARRRLIQAALSYEASGIWAELHPEDPGWEIELKEEMLDDAVRAYVGAKDE